MVAPPSCDARIQRREHTAALAQVMKMDNRSQLAILERTSDQIASAKRRLRRLVKRYPSQQAKISALLASSEKREAQIQFERSRNSTLSPAESDAARAQSLSALESALAHYWDAFLQDRAGYWAVVQFLSLTVVLRKCAQDSRFPVSDDQTIKALWTVAELQSLEDLQLGATEERPWALGNLIELYLLAPLIFNDREHDLKDSLVEKTKELASMASQFPAGVFSTRRQVARYIEWYDALTNQEIQPVIKGAQQVIQMLPLTEQDRPR